MLIKRDSYGLNKDIHQHILQCHYDDDIMGAIASQITSITIVYSTVYSDADQLKHQSSASLAFVRGIHRGPVNSPHKWPVTRKMFPFDDVIMRTMNLTIICLHLNVLCRWDVHFLIINYWGWQLFWKSHRALYDVTVMFTQVVDSRQGTYQVNWEFVTSIN